MRVDAERGDRTAVHMSVILLTELLSLNCAVTDRLSLSAAVSLPIFSVSSFSSWFSPSLSLICLFDFLRHLILSNVSKRMVNSLLYLTSFLFPPSVLSLLFFFFSNHLNKSPPRLILSVLPSSPAGPPALCPTRWWWTATS